MCLHALSRACPAVLLLQNATAGALVGALPVVAEKHWSSCAADTKHRACLHAVQCRGDRGKHGIVFYANQFSTFSYLTFYNAARGASSPCTRPQQP